MKRIVLILIATLIGMSAWATNESFLNFVKKDGKVTQYVANGTKLTFSGKTINVNSNGTASEVSMVGLHHLEFGKSVVPSVLMGDVNGDGTVDITDINALVNILLGTASPDDYKNPYVNDDDVIDIVDVNIVISLIVSPS